VTVEKVVILTDDADAFVCSLANAADTLVVREAMTASPRFCRVSDAVAVFAQRYGIHNVVAAHVAAKPALGDYGPPLLLAVLVIVLLGRNDVRFVDCFTCHCSSRVRPLAHRLSSSQYVTKALEKNAFFEYATAHVLQAMPTSRARILTLLKTMFAGDTASLTIAAFVHALYVD
jgi:hypothetical protein